MWYKKKIRAGPAQINGPDSAQQGKVGPNSAQPKILLQSGPGPAQTCRAGPASAAQQGGRIIFLPPASCMQHAGGKTATKKMQGRRNGFPSDGEKIFFLFPSSFSFSVFLSFPSFLFVFCFVFGLFLSLFPLSRFFSLSLRSPLSLFPSGLFPLFLFRFSSLFIGVEPWGTMGCNGWSANI